MKLMDIIYEEEIDKEFINAVDYISNVINEQGFTLSYFMDDEDDEVIKSLCYIAECLINDMSLIKQIEYKSNSLYSASKFLIHIHNLGKLVLYRYIFISSPNNLNRSNIGRSYTNDKDITKDWVQYLYDNASNLDDTLTTNDFYLATIETPSNNINYCATLWHNLVYPGEDEINITNTTNIKLLNLEHVTIPESWGIK
jgi:hypothetical protein